MNRGLHHIGVATHDMERTLDFYENVLGFAAVVCEMIEPEGGGAIRHAFFDVGNGELFAFMEAGGALPLTSAPAGEDLSSGEPPPTSRAIAKRRPTASSDLHCDVVTLTVGSSATGSQCRGAGGRISPATSSVAITCMGVGSTSAEAIDTFGS